MIPLFSAETQSCITPGAESNRVPEAETISMAPAVSLSLDPDQSFAQR